MSFYDDQIYIHDEIFLKQQTNDVLIKEMSERWGKDYQITADIATPNKIAEFAKTGFDIKGCKKNAESVKNGIDWMKQRWINIMPHCTNHINEIQSYKWKEDKNGENLDEPVKYKDDCMDADRYGLDYYRLSDGDETSGYVGGGERVFGGGKEKVLSKRFIDNYKINLEFS